MTLGNLPASAVAVRPATPGDLPGLQEVARCTWGATYSGKIPDADIERFLAANYTMEALSQVLERLGEGILVAVQGTRVIGYATCGVNREGIGELFAIDVLPECQRRGIGRRLWEAVIGHLRSLGVPEMALWVLASNNGARRFYERQWAQVFGIRTFPVGEGQIEEVGYRVRLDVR